MLNNLITIFTMLEFYQHEILAQDYIFRAYSVAKDKTEQTITKINSSNKPQKKKEDNSDKYKKDVEVLEKRFGTLNPGMTLILTLQETLQILPRNRKRSDTYNGLVKHLQSRGVTLTINSLKTKRL